MNGKAAQLERWLEAIRQRALVRGGDLVGQVPCESTDVHHDLGRCHADCSVCNLGLTPSCPDCGAAV